jgi:hypothetical protein
MSASRGPRLSALWLMLMGTMTLGLARPAGAQFLGNDAQPMFPDPIPRSTRLLGMGNLTLADDRNNRLTLWDFARNPVGLAESDSVSEIEIWPGAQSADAQRDLVAGDDNQVRQLLDARGQGLAYEVFHRSRHGLAYGARGTFGNRSVDQLYDQQTGVDQKFTAPDVEAILNGVMPRIGERMHWSVRGTFGRQNVENRFHTIVKNPAGEFVGITGDQVNPPDFFTPDQYTISTNGVGLGFSYHAGPWLTATAGADFLTMKIDGENSDVRHFSGTGESRPYQVYQSTAMGRIGSSFEWIADGRFWGAQNEQTWLFTLAAGIQQDPLTGRGFMYQRREEGSSLRTRASYALGDLKLGGSFETGYGKVEITGPRNNDYTSFNYFLNTLNYRQNADSLVLPDSVRSDVAYQRDVSFALGGTYPVSWRHGLVGLEYHHFRGTHDQVLTGTGPRQMTWDVRAGFEVPCTKILTSRVGFIHRSNDADTYTANNETIGNTVTAGLGVLHPGARWSLQASYGYEWLAVDYPDPYESHGGGHQFALNLRWGF